SLPGGAMTARAVELSSRRLGWPLLVLLVLLGGALAACGTAPGGITPELPPVEVSEAPAAEAREISPAEVSKAGADCTSDEILDGLLMGMPRGTGTPAPAAGTVPEGFEAVAVVLCTMELEMLEPAAPPVTLPPVIEPGYPIPDAPDPGHADPS